MPAALAPSATASRSTGRRCPSRRTGRGQATCERLCEAAADLFIARGYDRVSLDEIVLTAGGSKTNVYAFYGGKEDLFLAAVEHACGDLLAPFLREDVGGMALEEGLARLGDVLVELLLTPRHLALFRLVIGETGRFPRLGSLWYANGPMLSRAHLAAFIRQRVLSTVTDCEAEKFARLFHDMAVQDLLQRALFEPAPAPLAERRRVVRDAAEIVAGLIRQRPA